MDRRFHSWMGMIDCYLVRTLQTFKTRTWKISAETTKSGSKSGARGLKE